jgi:hypothetical protein
MRILSLEIRRNTCGYQLTLLGQLTPDQALVGQVRVASDAGAEVILPLSQGQIAAALASIAQDAAADAAALVSALTPPSFSADRVMLEHVPDALVFEVGKTYVTRDGANAVRIERIDPPEDDAAYPVRGGWVGVDGSTENWTLAGRYYSDSDSSTDLVREARPGEVFPVDAVA